ncbi:hypothetical protein B0H14DRAFT_2599209 [Mycena olivaceomarginata]|nr:hypothetical protein B0H14DRAFT_2599209 [Mycena olivaceomarginata]
MSQTLKSGVVFPCLSRALGVYVNDFTDVVGNIQWFMAQSETAGYSKQGIFDASETQKRQRRHQEHREVAIDNENTRKAATELKKNHHIIPLPAYDIHGNLIHPTQYRDTLKGAVVRVTVLLKHWNITVKDNVKQERHLHRGHQEPARLGGCPEICRFS